MSREAYRPLDTTAEALTIVVVPACRIFVSPGFNSRKDFAPKPGKDTLSDPELLADIKARGLDTPIRVEPIKAETIKGSNGTPDVVIPHDSYLLVFGERRLRACKAIDPDYPVIATVQPKAQRSPLGRRLANLHENLNRKSLTLWETGEAMADLQETHKLDKKGIAEALGYTEAHCGNVLRIRNKLAPEIWEHIRKVGSSIDRAVLFRVCMLPTAEQPAAYAAELEKRKTRGAAAVDRKKAKAKAKAKRNGKAAEEGDETEEGEIVTESPTETTRAHAAKALLAANPYGSKAAQRGAEAAIAYVLGDDEALS